MSEPVKLGLQTINLADVAVKPISWIWEGRFPAGRLSVVAGDGETNKSFLLLDLAVRIADGRPLPDTGVPSKVRGPILWITGEDDPEEVKRRANNLGYTGRDIIVVTGIIREKYEDPIDLSRDILALGALIQETGAVLVVIDPMSAFEPGVDGNSDNDVRSTILRPLGDVASTTGAAIIFIKHLNKNPNLPARYRLSGSIAYIAAPRAAWEVVNDKKSNKRLLRKLKANVWPIADPLLFWVNDEDKVQYEEAPIGAGPSQDGDDPKKPGRPAQMPAAKALWEELLSEGPVSSARANALGAVMKMTVRTLDRARRELGLRMISVDGEKLWAFPQEDDE